MAQYLPERTVHYKTFMKATLVAGLAQVFASHPDVTLRTTDVTYPDGTRGTQGVKVSLEWSRSKDRYPAVIVRFFERNVKRMGVGHQEYILINSDDVAPTRMFHNWYDGDLEFGIYAMTSYDRELMADTLVQTLTMGILEGYTESLFTSIYGDETITPDARWNFLNICSDQVSGFGETQAPVPWGAEDEQLYICQYRTPVMGEFYSVPPVDLTSEYVGSVPIFPYIEGIDSVPTGDTTDPAAWM